LAGYDAVQETRREEAARTERRFRCVGCSTSSSLSCGGEEEEEAAAAVMQGEEKKGKVKKGWLAVRVGAAEALTSRGGS
jgi:hypothetical protein